MDELNEFKGKNLRKKVLEQIQDSWPIHPSEVCRKFGIADTVSNISKIKYHFDRLKEEKRINTKKIDRALVAWPAEIEELRSETERSR